MPRRAADVAAARTCGAQRASVAHPRLLTGPRPTACARAQLNIAFPATGMQKSIKFEDERKLRAFYDKRIGQEVSGDVLGDEYKGYVFRISGGNDKEGFAMMQGVATTGRVRLLLRAGMPQFRPLREGQRRRKSVRGCIVDQNLSVLNLVIVKKGEHELPGITDSSKPRRLGPKRASKIRKLFNLSKEDDVRKYVVRREIPAKEGKKPTTKAPRIQRLVTPLSLQRKRHRIAIKKRRAAASKEAAATYAKLLAQRQKDRRTRRLSQMEKQRRLSSSSGTSATAPAAADAKKPVTTATGKTAPAPAPAPAAKPAAAAAAPKAPKAPKAAPSSGSAKGPSAPAKKA